MTTSDTFIIIIFGQKPQAEILKLNNVNGCNDILLYVQRLKWHYHKNAAGALYKQQRHISHVCSHSNSNNWHNHGYYVCLHEDKMHHML